MSAVVLLAALAAAALLTWFHLRPSGVRSAQEIPSLQHLRGPSPRRSRVLPLEEPAAWGLRLAALMLALAGLWAARSGRAPDLRPLVVVDPDSPPGAWARASSLPGTVGVLGLDGDIPRLLGAVGPATVEALRACSDTRAACLLRAADRSGQPLVLVGTFGGAEWRSALARRGRDFAFVWTGAAPPAAAASPSAAPPAPSHVRLEGRSAAAQVWAAAFASVGGLPEMVVVDAGPGAAARRGAALTVVAVQAASPAGPGQPGAEASPGSGLLFPDPLDLAAGIAGLGLQTSLGFVPDTRFTALLPIAAVRRTPEGVLLALAATADDLGAWAHRGLLGPLARALLAGALPPPAELSEAPAGGALGWADAAGQPAAVGLLDVAPGRYLRTDGRAALSLERPHLPGVAPLDPGALEGLGGHPWSEPPPARPSSVALLFASAALLWLAGVWLTRRARRAWLPALAVALLLALLAADTAWRHQIQAGWEAVLAVTPGPAASALEAQARAADLHGDVRAEGGSPPCAAAQAAEPCSVVSTVGFAAAPPPAADALVFDAQAPRVDLLSVDAPREILLGSAAELWATLRIRRAAGRRVTVTARPTDAAPASTELPVDGPDVVRTVRLVVSPLSEGIGFVAVEAVIAGEAQAQDGRLLALAARARPPRRLVLAAAPGWEARAAVEALETAGTGVELLTLLGARAVVARGRSGVDPRQLLADTSALDGVDLIALVGFPARELDPRAAAGLRRFVEAGGAALLLDAPGAAAALGVTLPASAAAAPVRPLEGQLDLQPSVAFRGYAPPAELALPPGADVLGRVGTAGGPARQPWVVGRALGQGRMAVVTAPDLWRVSPPGQGREAYRGLLLRLLGWLEAPRASRSGVVLAEDWASLRVQSGAGFRDVPLPASAPVDGLGVDPVDLPGFLRVPRARLRAEAARIRHPFLEPEGAEALGAAWRRLPPAPRWRLPLPLRSSDVAWCALAALVALEALARRLYRGAGSSGTRASTAPSSADTGGTTTGDGRSQRASEAAAARAAAPRDAGSFAA